MKPLSTEPESPTPNSPDFGSDAGSDSRGTNLPSESSDSSPARAYRRRRDRRQSQINTGLFGLLVLGILNLAGYYALNASGPGASGSPLAPVAGPGGAAADNVSFGTATQHSTTCGDGRNATVESLPWVGAGTPPLTSQVFLEVVEQLDGDLDGGPEPTPAVTATSVCAGAPLTAAPSWYAVLRAPSGDNVAVFSYSTNWLILNHAASASIPNGSTLLLLANPALSGTSLALCVVGDVGATPVQGCANL
ncbi:MAG: hypothetical protein L3K16_05190 [Thermoplasmata archaeon]|nr:hypothetical protein [Thermoplasmata archaeon]